MSRNSVVGIFVKFLGVSGFLLMAIVAFALTLNVVDEFRFRSWRYSLEKSGIIALAEEQIRSLEVQYETSGRYPCSLPGDTQGSRLRYGRTHDSYYIFIPMDGSRNQGIIFLEKQWQLCTPSVYCPPQPYVPECRK